MKYKIFLFKDRVSFLQHEMPYGKVKVIETDDYGMTTVEITIDDSFDLLKVFHAGIAAGDQLPQPKVV